MLSMWASFTWGQIASSWIWSMTLDQLLRLCMIAGAIDLALALNTILNALQTIMKTQKWGAHWKKWSTGLLSLKDFMPLILFAL